MADFHLFTQYRGLFLQKLVDLAPTRSFARAVSEGVVAVLGGFREVPPHDKAGWIFHVLSRHRRAWLFALLVDESAHTLSGQIIPEVPWEYWVGKTNRNGWNAYDGDAPHDAAKEWHYATQQLKRREELLRRVSSEEQNQTITTDAKRPPPPSLRNRT